MANVLIASLGESPIIVTSMARALREGEKIALEKIMIIYPEEEPLVKNAFELIAYQLSDGYQVESCSLPFPDANTYERCFMFLQTLYGLLEVSEQAGDTVYFSLAGGRKSMSALMAILSPFYPNIQGLYHILDKFEENPAKRNFYTTEELYDFSDDEILKAKMNPPLESLKLVEIPFEYFARAKELRKILSNIKTGEELLESVAVSPESGGFFASIFQKRALDKILEIKLSPQAIERYRTVGANQQRSFKEFFRQLQFQSFRELRGKDKGGRHGGPFKGKDAIFWCAKRARTDERVFWYEKEGQVVICELGLHDSSYDNLSQYFSNDKPSIVEYPSKFGLPDLSEEGMLLAPLGKSPMVVTQAFRLLQEREGVRIKKIGLIFPQKNGEIRNGVSYLKDAFSNKGVEVKEYGIPFLDVDSKEKCEEFLKKIVQAIDELQCQNPEQSIHLLLSGGRKGMATLSLFAAQRSNIPQVYHTLIADPDLEKCLEKEGSITELGKCRSRQERTERLFLKGYDLSKFELFKIPVIPLEIK